MSQISLKTRTPKAALPSFVNSLDISIDRRIRSFLDGHSDGADVFDALYGDVTAEPIPAKMAALLHR